MSESEIILKVSKLNEFEVLSLYMEYYILMLGLNYQLWQWDEKVKKFIPPTKVSQHSIMSLEQFIDGRTTNDYGEPNGIQYSLGGIYYYYRLFKT